MNPSEFGRAGWTLGDIVRLSDGWYRVAVFHMASKTGAFVFAPTLERLRARARLEVDLVYRERALKLTSVLQMDELSGSSVSKITR